VHQYSKDFTKYPTQLILGPAQVDIVNAALQSSGDHYIDLASSYGRLLQHDSSMVTTAKQHFVTILDSSPDKWPHFQLMCYRDHILTSCTPHF